MIKPEPKDMNYRISLKRRIAFVVLSMVTVLLACQPKLQEPPLNVAKIEKLIHSGEIKKAGGVVDSIKSSRKLLPTQMRQLDSLIEMGRRIRIDFRLNEQDINARLSKYFQKLDTTTVNGWERSGKLEMRMIDGQKRYFGNAVPNLFRLDDAARVWKEKVDGVQVDSLDLFCLQHTAKVISATKSLGQTTNPVKMRLSYTVEVKPNVVPDGKLIRCWLPFPREGNARQKNINLLKSVPEKAMGAPEGDLQHSVYLERKAVKDQPTTFQIEFEVETLAQYFDLSTEMIKPYDTNSPVYKENTAERAPQIVFTPQIRQLAARILQGETNSLLKVQKIYNWINDSVRWASALEYSTFENIPAYVLKTHHGDCGMQTLLFMTLARSQGIPVKWQSGWMLHPGKVNLHDWCEVYYEGIGWVPLDMSFGLQISTDEKIRNFYRSGIDAYRLIVNDDFGRKLSPEKNSLRSEPYDFQRGELEWEGGNLYFDQWSWHMDVEYK